MERWGLRTCAKREKEAALGTRTVCGGEKEAAEVGRRTVCGGCVGEEREEG